jgi:hypothetical protein
MWPITCKRKTMLIPQRIIFCGILACIKHSHANTNKSFTLADPMLVSTSLADRLAI